VTTQAKASSPITIERLTTPTDDIVRELSAVLLDAVASNGSVSFMPDLTLDQAGAWWRKIFHAATPRTVILAARDERGIVGTVQLQPAWAPNQPHRADVAKLMVHRRARSHGVGRTFMRELERHAREQRFTLLVLDTCKDSAAERLYTSLGWQRVGEVPQFALQPDGSWCDTVFFFKRFD
jgi:GNAT superfamily N-acetyltransferase